MPKSSPGPTLPGMLAAPMAATKTRKPKAPAKPTFAEIGRQAADDAQRTALLKELEAQGWNLSATARELGMVDASAVIRAVRRLGLEDRYERAKERGEVRAGPR